MDYKSIFDINSEVAFTKKALELFKFQFEENPVYRSFCDLLYKHPSAVRKLEDIPFLPIEFFKTHKVLSTKKEIQQTFTSSGTSGSVVSQHHVADLNLYKTSFQKGFAHFYGRIEDYAVLALLPSYLERDGSSLVYMVEDMIQESKHPKSGFYLDEYEKLISVLNELKIKGKRVILLGVTYALLDLAENYHLNFPELIIMETGGMKGRRKEMIREEVHEKIKKSYGVPQVFSEYGMTELLSQAYSNGNGEFTCPPWMQVLIRDVNYPFSILKPNCTGGINVIDLANIYSCSFIETQDLGKISMNNTFEVLGRFDNSDVRGCNLLIN